MKHYSISQRKKSRGNSTWYSRTFDGGVLVREESLHTKRKADAQAWLDAMNAARFMPEKMFSGMNGKDKPVDEALKAFLRSKEGETNTYRAYVSRMACWARWCGNRHVATLREFTREMAVDYAGTLSSTDSPKTAREKLRLLHQFLDWAADTYEMDGYDPMKTVVAPKLVKRAKKFWTPAEIDRILDKAPTPEFRLFWSLMAFAGLRHAEACSFGPSMIENGKLHIIGKGNKEEFLPVSERLKKEIAAVDIHDGMFRTSRYKKSERCMETLKAAVAAAGMDNSDAINHKFRHSFASNLLRAKVTVPATAKLMRHSEANTTLSTYSHLLAEDLSESVNSV